MTSSRHRLATAAKGALAAAAAAGLGWGAFEAGWVRLRTIEVPLSGLPSELDGLRIAHLSDFHLGVPSRGARAVERAVEWAAEREPDLTLVTGDLLSHPRAADRLRALLARLPRCYAVLGNHEFDSARDPFSRPAGSIDLGSATLLADDARTVELRGRRVQIVGIDPRSFKEGRARPWLRADAAADLRILLCHYPSIVRTLPPGAFQLVLAGHLHAGQICLPWPGGKLHLAHLGTREVEGLYRRSEATLHISPGLGTTFVPFRFLARPEATELVLQSEH